MLSLFRVFIQIKSTAIFKTATTCAKYLGQYNDLFIAEGIFNNVVEQDPSFWFALGWVKAKQPQLQSAQQKLYKLLVRLKLSGNL